MSLKHNLNATKNFKPLNKCIFCEKSFSTRRTVETHLSIHTKEKPYECDHCDANFSFLSALSVHRKRIHLRIKYTCKICHKIFITPSNLAAHEQQHHKLIITDSKKITNETKLTLNSEKVKMQPRQLQKCIKSKLKNCLSSRNLTHFSNLTNQTNETNVHPNAGIFKCQHCGSRFCSYLTLKSHSECLHLGKLYECTACNNQFEYLSDVVLHERSKIHLKNVKTAARSNRVITERNTERKENEDHVISDPNNDNALQASMNITAVSTATVEELEDIFIEKEAPMTCENHKSDSYQPSLDASSEEATFMDQSSTKMSEVTKPDEESVTQEFSMDITTMNTAIDTKDTDSVSNTIVTCKETSNLDKEKFYRNRDSKYSVPKLPLCPKKFNSLLMEHLSKPGGDNMSCLFCSSRFSRQRKMTRHLLSTHRISLILSLTRGPHLE